MENAQIDIEKLFANVEGFLSEAEARLLHRLAIHVPAGGRIVEIGNYQGRSTIALGLGAKVSSACVYSVDPHEDLQVNVETSYGMKNHAALLRNLIDFDVAEVVRVISVKSNVASCYWHGNVDLAFIDGSHEYEDVVTDLGWSMFINGGKLVLHDTSGHFPGVTRALDEFLARGVWEVVERVDSTAVLMSKYVRSQG